MKHSSDRSSPIFRNSKPLATVALMCGALACSKDTTQLVVLAGSDFAIPQEVVTVRAIVADEVGTELATEEFDVVGPDLEPGADQYHVPLSFGVLPRDGDPNLQVKISLEARDSGDKLLAVRRAMTWFVPSQRRLLPLFLPRACKPLWESCEFQNKTCALESGVAACIELEIDPTTLVVLEPGKEEGAELDLGCTPGKKTCTEDGSGVLDCKEFGEEATLTECKEGESCVDGECRSPGIEYRNLTVDFLGEGSGTVTSNPVGIACSWGAGVSSGDCAEDFEKDVNVELTAAAQAGSKFTRWSGSSGCGTNAKCTVRMDQAKTVTATFNTDVVSTGHTLAIAFLGDGMGSVNVAWSDGTSPASDTCAAPSCEMVFAAGTQVTLNPVPTGDSIFASWGGVCEGNATWEPCAVEMNGDLDVTVTFDPDTTTRTYTLNVSVMGRGLGRVSTEGGDIDCGNGHDVCSVTLPENTPVQLRAEAAVGGASIFSGWRQDCTGLDLCDVTLDQDRTVEAVFRVKIPELPLERFDLTGEGKSEIMFAANRKDVGTDIADGGRFYVLPSIANGGQIDMEARTVAHQYDGPEDNARLGEVFALPGNMNDGLYGDTYNDVLVGAPGANSDGLGGLGTGAVYMIGGGPSLSTSGDISTRAQSTVIGERAGDAFGSAMTVVYDLDVDRDTNRNRAPRRDIIVGAPGSDATSKGKVYVFGSNRPYTATGGSTPMPANFLATYVLESGAQGDRFGREVADLGDVNGDDISDFAVGAPIADRSAGRVAVYYGFDTGGSLGVAAPVPAFEIHGSEPGNLVGRTISGIGDWNADGYSDFAVTATYQGTHEAKVLVFLGRPDRTGTLGVDDADITIIGDETEDFGLSLTGGDFDLDGISDLVIGAPKVAIFRGGNLGEVYIYSGGVDPATSPTATLHGGCGASCANEAFGYTVGLAGDLNGDGHVDLGIGSKWGGSTAVQTAGEANRGRVTIFLAKTTGLDGLTSERADGKIVGENERDALCSVLVGTRNR